jgi:hypothetical protein
MGRAQPTRQAITVRFDENDEELIQWLGQFAQSQTMTKVVKLACYMMSGIQPEEGLLALLPEVQSQRIDPVPVQDAPAAHEGTTDILAAVMQELSALREEITQQRAESSERVDNRHANSRPPTLPEEDWPPNTQEPVVSSGIDMGGPRRRRDRPPDVPRREPPPEVPFDADEARRKLVESINAYGKNLRDRR